MDTSAYLLELAQKFHLSSFDGDISQWSGSSDERSSVASADASSAEVSELLDASAMNSPPMRHPRAAAASGSSTAAESKEKERASRQEAREDLRIKYEALKRSSRKQAEELERVTKQSVARQPLRTHICDES